MTQPQPLQDLHLPDNPCFGCGPGRADGLRLKSYPAGDGGLVAEWRPETRFQGPPGVLHGGFVSVPLDCHSIWTAMAMLTGASVDDDWVEAVTAEYRVRLRRPTPTGALVRLRSHPGWIDGGRASVRTTATVEGEVTAELEGVFVAAERRGGRLVGGG